MSPDFGSPLVSLPQQAKIMFEAKYGLYFVCGIWFYIRRHIKRSWYDRRFDDMVSRRA